MKHNINIFCNNERVGIIEIDLNSNNVELIYDENWKNIGFELSPHLKFDKSIDSNGIKKFVNNLLPEGNGLDAISIILQISKANKFGLLEAIGNETAGALTFSPDNIVVTNFREISNEELTERIINKENINNYNVDYILVASSITDRSEMIDKDKLKELCKVKL